MQLPYKTIDVVTGLIPSTIGPSSGAGQHIHAFVCSSATCTRDTTTNTQNLTPTSQPTISPRSEIPSSLQVQFDRETSPLTYSNTNSNLVSREEKVLQKQNQIPREGDDPQITSMLQHMSEMLINLRSDNRCLKEDMAFLWDKVSNIPQSPR